MLNFGNKKITKVYLGYVELSSSSSSAVVSYYADTNNIVQIPLVSGANALTRYTPTKSGWTFVGWREDASANSSVLTSKTMGSSNISLYAVFSKKVTATFKSYDNTQYVNGYIYYNNGNITNPDITTPTGASYSGWNWRGWSAASDTTANASVSFANGGTVRNLWSDFTYYGLYQQTITLSYNGNGSTSGSTASQSGTRYYNAAGNYSDPSFTLKTNGFSKTNYTFTKWALGSTGGTQYAVGASVTLSANTTFYAIWERTSNPVSWLSGASYGEGGTYGSGYPTQWTVTYTDVDCNHPEDCDIYIRNDIRQIYCNSDEPWSVEAQATGSTGGNQYMEIVVPQITGCYITCNGTTINSAGTYTINVSGLSSVTMYVRLSNFEYSVSYVSINSIRFY